MLPAPDIILSAADYIDAAARRVEDSTQSIFLVRLEPSGWATVQRDLLQRLLHEGKGEHNLGSLIPPQPLPSLFPDLPLDNALRFINNHPIIPVVNRANPRKLEGVISSQSVFAKYGAPRKQD
jgi:CIC family chloride channel protein